MPETYPHLHDLIQVAYRTLAHDKVNEALVDGMWSGYMEEAEKYDTRVNDAWKDDANRVLVFAGLFSPIVATFIVESYQELSSGSASGDKTAHPPGLSIIWVNSLWLLSLVLSISSALVVTLVQQWARRYTQLPQIPSLLGERERGRTFLFRGISIYPMRRTVTVAQALLHLSVFFFFFGLVIFLFAVSKMVAIVVSICVGLFGLVYLILTILPCFDHRFPYRTPMSSVWWYAWHASLFVVSLCARWLLKSLHGALISDDPTSSVQRRFNDWWPLLDDVIKRHKMRLKDGFLGGTFRAAVESLDAIDPTAPIGLLNALALADENKVEDFVASIPGDTIVRLIGAVPYGNIFYQHLSILMQSCVADSIVLGEDVRRRRLIVCLNAIHHISRACNSAHSGVSFPESFLEDVRIKFANIAIRVTSRSICALLVRRILRNRPTRGSELLWLQDVLGESSNTILNSLGNLTTVDHMNVDSFVYGILSYPTGDLPVAQVTCFVDTLAILMNAGGKMAIIHKNIFEEGLSELFRRAEHDSRLHAVVEKLRTTSKSVFPAAAPEPKLSISHT
ncbi:hypothetical protein H4582DRAFT_1942943 [Lactarius indigo]|nr:hypothetical protein H4582DRAFT_1942943 [Lactarius indigo]